MGGPGINDWRLCDLNDRLDKLLVISLASLTDYLKEKQLMASNEPKPTSEAVKQTEDSIATAVAEMNDFTKATTYAQLHASGMTLDKAHQIRLKAGAIN